MIFFKLIIHKGFQSKLLFVINWSPVLSKIFKLMLVKLPKSENLNILSVSIPSKIKPRLSSLPEIQCKPLLTEVLVAKSLFFELIYM